MTSKVWYVVAAGLVVPGFALVVLAFAQLSWSVEGMHRVVMPGKGELLLPAGHTTLYAERKAIVDGKAYRAPEGLAFTCGVIDPAGKPVSLARAGSVSYVAGGFEGESAFELELAAPGTYILSCEAPGPFVMAVGQGVGTWIVLMIAGAVPFGIGAIVFLVVLIMRRRQRRRAAAGGA